MNITSKTSGTVKEGECIILDLHLQRILTNAVELRTRMTLVLLETSSDSGYMLPITWSAGYLAGKFVCMRGEYSSNSHDDDGGRCVILDSCSKTSAHSYRQTHTKKRFPGRLITQFLHAAPRCHSSAFLVMDIPKASLSFRHRECDHEHPGHKLECLYPASPISPPFL